MFIESRLDLIIYWGAPDSYI